MKRYYKDDGVNYCLNQINVHRQELKLLIKRSAESIRRRAITLGLSISKNYYSAEDIDFLIENYENKGSFFCANQLNRSRQSVLCMASKLGLHFFNENIWADKEDLILKQNYEEIGPSGCSILLNRSIKSCQSRARKFNLRYKKSSLNNLWTDEQKEYLIKNYNEKGPNVCSIITGHTKDSTVAMANKLNLKYNSGKRVLCLETNMVYNTLTEAQNVCGGGISTVCKNKKGTVGGFNWCYLQDFKNSNLTNKEYIDWLENNRNIKRKSVKCVETGVLFNSVSDAVRQTGFTSIPYALKNNKLAGDYHWEYVE